MERNKKPGHRPDQNIPLGRLSSNVPSQMTKVLNQPADQEQFDSLSDNEEAELSEFCETSSWETSSAVSENARQESKHGKAGGEKQSAIGRDSREDSCSEDSVTSEKLPQDRWEDTEYDDFKRMWRELQHEINDLENDLFDLNPNLPTTVQR